MSYSGGCIIGVCIHGTTVYFGGGGRLELGMTLAQMQSMATFKTSTNPQHTWPTFDGAWSPAAEVVNSFGSNPESVWCVAEMQYKWRGHYTHCNGLLVSGNAGTSVSNFATVHDVPVDVFGSYSDVIYLSPSSNAHLDTTYPLAFTTLILDREDEGGMQGGYVGFEAYGSSLTTSSSSLWREVAPVQWVELPNNQELISYKRADIAPSAEKVMTLDGASRRYITGYGSTTIDATWRWSDTGYAAGWLQDILAISMDQGEPLVVYMPQGRWNGIKTLDLVVCDTPPEVTMVAPGVYELHIVGTCQP